MKAYTLQHHVSMCLTADAAVFLDTTNDAYVGLPIEQARGLERIVDGWPSSSACDSENDEGAAAVAESLLQRGILARTEPGARTAHYVPASVPTIDGTLADWDNMPSSHIRFSHISRFLTSYIWAATSLRHRHFAQVLEQVRCLKAENNDRAVELPLSSARDLLAAFYHLRPFVYARRGKCLLDSLTLVRFLAHHRVYATLVIAVRTRPFGAHSWVQQGSCILNGTPEYCLPYTPILAI